MKRLFAFILAFGISLGPPLAVTAQEVAPDVEGTQEGDDLEQLERRSFETLESLFEDLAAQTRAPAANRISQRIWQELNKSGSDTINLLMNRATQAFREDRHSVALDLLDQVVVLAPDFSEGWNRRATVHFAMKEYGRSLSDIEQTLAIQPRHFGALSGLAKILEIFDRDRDSLAAWYKVLEIYPANEEAQRAVIKLEEKLTGANI